MKYYMLRMDYCTIGMDEQTGNVVDVTTALTGCQPDDWKNIYDSQNDDKMIYNSKLGGLRWQENSGYAKKPRQLELKGTSFDALPTTISSWLPDMLKKDINVSRVDFAIDLIVVKREWTRFVDDFMDYKDRECQDKMSGKRRPAFLPSTDVRYGGAATTLYVGTRKSCKFYRTYNKSLQNPNYRPIDRDGRFVDVPDDCFVIRAELQLNRKTLHIGDTKYEFSVAELAKSYADGNLQYCGDWVLNQWAGLSQQGIPVIDDLLELYSGRAECFSELATKALFCSNLPETDSPDDDTILDSTDGSTLCWRPIEIYKKIGVVDNSIEACIRWIGKQYGHYIPFMLADVSDVEAMYLKCYEKFHFIPRVLEYDKYGNGRYYMYDDVCRRIDQLLDKLGESHQLDIEYDAIISERQGKQLSDIIWQIDDSDEGWTEIKL